MRNFRNRERDKLPVPFVHPPERVVVPPYIARLIWCNQLLRAQLEFTHCQLAGARAALMTRINA